MDICVRVGRRIRYLRTSKGITQTVLADRAELSTRTPQRIENAHIDAGIRTLERIARALGVKVRELVEEP